MLIQNYCESKLGNPTEDVTFFLVTEYHTYQWRSILQYECLVHT